MNAESSEPKDIRTDKDGDAQQRDATSGDDANVDSDAQKAMRDAYQLQQRRMRCPGCGEADETF